MDKYCPHCGETYPESETTCPACGVALLDLPAGSAPLPDAELVEVFGTTEQALLPLVQMALGTAGIEHTTWNKGLERILGRRTSSAVGETDAPLQVLVRSEDAARAREILRELEAPGVAVESVEPSTAPTPRPVTGASVSFFDKETNTPLGQITAAQFESLAAHLERESEDDDDYYIDQATLALLQERQADASVVELLRRALGSRTGMDVRWSRP